MLSLKPGSGLWFTAAGTGGEETAIDNTAVAGMSCGLSLNTSYMSWAVLPCLKALEGRDQVFETWSVPFCSNGLSRPPLLSLFLLLALSSMKSSQPKPSHCLVLLKGFYFWSEWLVMQRQVQEQGECPATGMVASKGKHPNTTAVTLPFVTLKFH